MQERAGPSRSEVQRGKGCSEVQEIRVEQRRARRGKVFRGVPRDVTLYFYLLNISNDQILTTSCLLRTLTEQ